MKHRSALVFALICVLLACAGIVEPPPVALSSRESLVGAVRIVQVENTSSEPLTELVVTFRSAAGEERTFNVPQLDGFGKVEIGWKKLGGWQIEPGTEIKVRSAGFGGSFDGAVEPM